MTDPTQSTSQIVGAQVATTLEQLLPALLAGATAGAGAASPLVATIEALAPVVVQFIQAQQMSSSQLVQLFTAVAQGVNANQAVIDAAASAAGIPVPEMVAPGTPLSPAPAA